MTTRNRLYYGDNLDILDPNPPDGTTPIEDESIDLIYLDPPFNSNRAYSVIFKEQSGRGSAAQIQAFEDTWRWGPEAERTLRLLPKIAPTNVVDLVNNLTKALKYNDVSAYIVMLAPRLLQMHRVLKKTGTLWFHCDSTASHYVKILLDSIFGATNYINEVVRKRTYAHSDVGQGAKHCGRIHDTLLVYAKKSGDHFWNVVYQSYDRDYIGSFYSYVEYPDGTLYRIKDPAKGILKEVRGKRSLEDPNFEWNGRRLQLDNLTAAKPGGDVEYEWKGVKPYKGRYWAYSKGNMERFEREGRLYYSKAGMPRYKRYLDEMPGVPLQDLWNDIELVSRSESLGFKTQKPIALMKRIIESACPKDGVILDPFCGCGTTICAAQELDRAWVGIDITYLAILVITNRLRDLFGNQVQYEEEGSPKDFAGAVALAERDKYQFEYWVCRLLGAHPTNDPTQKKRRNGGIDGIIYLYGAKDQKHPKKVAIQVKGGKTLNPDQVRAFGSAVDNHNAEAGIFVTLYEPTAGMITAAAKEGFWGNSDIPKIQLISVQDLLSGEFPRVPTFTVKQTFKRARKSRQVQVNPKWMFEEEDS